QTQAPLLRPCVGPLVRQHLSFLVRSDRDRGGEPLARARDAVGADVVLRDPPVELLALDEHTPGFPGRDVRAGLLLRVGQGQVDDVVRAPGEVLATFLVGDHVVGRRHETLERAGDDRVVPERAERPDGRHSCTLDRVVRTLRQAAAWIDEVGLALVFPKADVVLPSLWEQVNGSAADNWAVRDPDGGFVRWTDEMSF